MTVSLQIGTSLITAHKAPSVKAINGCLVLAA